MLSTSPPREGRRETTVGGCLPLLEMVGDPIRWGDACLIGCIHSFEGRLSGPLRRGCDHAPSRCCCLDSKGLLMKSARPLHQMDDKVPPATLNRNVVARALLFSHRNCGLCWCLSSSQSWSVGLSTQHEAMGFARSA